MGGKLFAHVCEYSPPLQGAGSSYTPGRPRTAAPAGLSFSLHSLDRCHLHVCLRSQGGAGRLQPELRNQISPASAFLIPTAQGSSSRPGTNSCLKGAKVTPQFHWRQFTPCHWQQLQLLPVRCAIRSINRKFLQGKLDCCCIQESHRRYSSMCRVACLARSNPVT